MKRLIILSVALLTVLGARSQNPQITETNVAVVTGEYEKEYEPDEIYVQITIREKDSKGKISIEEQQNEMFKTLTACGLNLKEALKVQNLSSTYYKKNQSLAYGKYELKLRTPEEFHKVYAALDELGLSSVSIDRFDRSDKKQLEMEAEAEAMKNARSKAEAIAAADGIKIGKCIYFSSDTYIDVADALQGRVSGLAMAYGSSGQPQFETDSYAPEIGTITIRATVQARFSLEHPAPRNN